MKKKVGIIVPVYNTEKYISQCIESILSQTYENFRLIIIDDASPDNAGVISDEYAEKDHRITVIHQKNTGVNRARANGVKHAEDCEYITFVDSDDTITSDAIEILVSAMSSDTDIVVSYRVENIPAYPPIEQDKLSITEYRKSLLSFRTSSAPWGKLFRRELFDDSVFDIPRNIVVGEDLLMNIRLTCKTSKDVNVTHHDIYKYNIYDENTTKRFVSNPTFESSYHQLIISSIPNETERNDYVRFSIPYRLHKFLNIGGMEPDMSNLIETDFYKELKRDIAQYKYSIKSFRKYILFYSTNIILRSIVIIGKRTTNKVQQIIRQLAHP